MNFTNLTLTSYIAWVRDGSIDPKNVLEHYLAQAQSDTNNYWINVTSDYAHAHLDQVKNLPLAGAPIAIKDIINVTWTPMTGASKILSDYLSPYTASSYAKLEAAWGLMMGKVNMDEFAMGWSGENSAFWPSHNPYDSSRVTGGSSSGSAGAVAAGQCIAALGTDTGGSIRQPASFCGIVGVKPTYGRVSRHGVQAMTSWFDQVWVLTQTVDDAALLLQSISGYDLLDATSQQRDDHLSWTTTLPDPKGLKLCVLDQFMNSEGLDPLIRERIEQTISKLESEWYKIDRISMPMIDYSLAVYYIMVFAQVSTNMARYDGMRFGLQDDTSTYPDLKSYYADIRTRGFGDEVIRRILTGTHVLSAGYYDAYYNKALRVQQALRSEFARIFQQYDIIIWPTSPVFPWKIGSHDNDPVADYLADIYTVPVNVAWLPAMSMPVWFVETDWVSLPVWLQLIANHWREDQLFALGKVVEGMVF
jgi:aspartyl-tRNA(Asn)/glutamyl-tRNA(Gln) amidotransferase subunit A